MPQRISTQHVKELIIAVLQESAGVGYTSSTSELAQMLELDPVQVSDVVQLLASDGILELTEDTGFGDIAKTFLVEMTPKGRSRIRDGDHSAP